MPTVDQCAPVPVETPAAAPDGLTRTRQTFSSAGLVAALETAWSAIRHRHPDVPEAVIVVGSGSSTKPADGLTLGHFASLRWQAGERRVAEVFVSGEGLARTAPEVFTTLLHEAGHGIADTRRIKDTSRQGRWHNQRFAALADELGLTAAKDDKLGWSPCTLRPSTEDTYRDIIAALDAAMGAYRHPDELAEKTRANSNNGHALTCQCPRRIRVSASTCEEGPILCGICDAAFLTDEQRESAKPDDGIPSYEYRQAPRELATRRQLDVAGLRPGRQPVAGRLTWHHGTRRTDLYRIDLATTKRPVTPAQRAATEHAKRARRTCPSCTEVKQYPIPRRLGVCLHCATAGAP